MFGKPHSIPFAEWPARDRQLWEAALLPGAFLGRRGRAAHWAVETKNQTRKGYAKWLLFLKHRQELDDVLSPATRLTKDRLTGYVGWMRNEDLSSVTIASRLRDLVEALRVMEPQADLGLAVALSHSLKRQAAPRRQKHNRIVNSGEALEKILARLENMERHSYQSPIVRAGVFRDLVILAFLTARPIRRKNLASLRLGHHLTRQADGIYACRIPASEMKERLPLEFTLPAAISLILDRYLSDERPRLLRGNKTDLLWISNRGGPLRSFSLYHNVKKLGREVLGVDITPHLFRDSLATSFAIVDPEHMLAASRALGHGSLETTNRHYNQAKMLEASKAFEEVIAEAKAGTLP